MPSDESLLEQASECKAKGNDAFAAGQTPDAIASYSFGIALCDRVVVSSKESDGVKAALLGNRAMCHLKQLQFQPCIDDCTAALNMSSVDAKLRGKLLFRRAKARFLLHNARHALQLTTSTNNVASKSSTELLQESAKDLLLLLNQDPSNKEAQQLLTTVRGQHKVTAAASHASTTPIGKTIANLQQTLLDANVTEQLHQVKLLLGLLDNDLLDAPRELGRCHDAVRLLFNTSSTTTDNKLAVLAMQCLSTSCGNPVFVREHIIAHQATIQQVLQSACSSDISDLMVTCLAALARIILHADRDDPSQEIKGATALDYKIIVNCLILVLRYCQNNSNNSNSYTVIRASLDVLSTWTAGSERDHAIRCALANSHVHDPALPAPYTPQEIRNFTPQQLAAYKKRQAEQNARDQAWALQRAVTFVEQDGLKTLLAAATICPDHAVRREMAVAVGRLLVAIPDDDQVKSTVTPFLQDTTQQRGKDEPVIEEVYNEDGEDEQQGKVEEESNLTVSLETKMQRALITAALLLSKKELGAWALQFGWRESDTELSDLIQAKHNPRAMCLASELLSAAATIEAARPMVMGMTSSGQMEILMMSDDRDIRSGAASAVAKLGLSEKQSDEGEVMGLLLAACELLEDNKVDNASTESKPKKETAKQQFTSFATSTVERAIEMITYLISNTTVKEELAAGFSAQTDAPHSALERLVQTADLPGAGESLSGFGLATIFQNLAATNEQVRREAFEGKQVTMDQYDEMQRIQKTEEEKEIMDQQKDPDTQELCRERVRRMASANVPRALVALTESDGTSEHTLEQIVIAMNRMADEVSVRGIMIQQGVLSACIKIEKKEGPTETDTMKKVIRLARHCIAKLLITTNPTLLTSAQRLGSIKPLIELIRDIKANELQHFEALLSVTNLAGSGEDAKNRIVTEKGISTFHFAMFSDHNMVRTAATEAMCNLVPHKGMTEHLTNPDHLRLWFAFGVDYEENYECARAASGTLAMASQEVIVAQEIVKLAKFRDSMTAMLECGRLEIMHRTLALLLNLVLHGGETREAAVEAGLVTFCRAYIELQNHSKDDAELEFTEQDKQILPITVDMAKKIVKAVDE